MGRDLRIRIASGAVAAVFVYASVVGFLYYDQRNLLYHPGTARPLREDHGAEAAEIVHVKTSDGLALEGWYFAPRDKSFPTILHVHGNAGAMGDRMPRVRAMIDAGYGVLLAEYRGYGGNPGYPTEQGLYEDARAYVDFLTREKHTPPSQIIMYGESLGTGVAVQMATEYPFAGLILEAPFTSAAAIAQSLYFYVPVGLLMADRFESDRKIKNVRAPILIVHGDLDRTVPIRFGRRLFDFAPEPKAFALIPGAGHGDLYDKGAATPVLAFLNQIRAALDSPREKR